MKPHDIQPLPSRSEGKITKKDELLESLPESMRWDPVPGSVGHQAPESASEDEDPEGRSVTEQLVDNGVEAAIREQVNQAARATKN
jgi:hypothetical protein